MDGRADAVIAAAVLGDAYPQWTRGSKIMPQETGNPPVSLWRLLFCKNQSRARVKLLTSCFKLVASAESSSLAAALSSAVALLV